MPSLYQSDKSTITEIMQKNVGMEFQINST